MHAIPKLKKRITLLLFGLTGTVLLLACLLAYQISIWQIRAGHDALFQSQFSAFTSQVQARRAINVVDIHHFEQGNGVILQLYENGRAVIPAIPQGGEARQGVIELAQRHISSEGAFSEVTGTFYINDAGLGKWRGEYQVIPSADRAWYGVLMMKTEATLSAEIRGMALRYTGIFMGALLCLVFIGRGLANMAAKPVGEAYQRQLEFTTAAGHDLRTPVAIIKSSAQIIQKNPAQARDNANKIVKESDRLSHLVDDLLMLSAGEAKLLRMDIGSVDLESALISLYEQFTPLAATKGLRLNLEFPDGSLPNVRGDANRIAQILSTFIENAFEYGKEGGYIDLSVSQSKRHVSVTVADHGPGIPDEQKALVFDQFYRADKSRSKKEHFGLGLSIARQLAAVQGATVSVADTPGGGATFVLRLKQAKGVLPHKS